MSIWQRIFGEQSASDGQSSGGFDFAAYIGGPIGQLIDSVRRWSAAALGYETTSRPETDQRTVRSVAFTIAAIVLSAKLAKADGRVSREEVLVFKQLFTVPVEEQQNVGRLFNQAREASDGYEPYADQVGSLFSAEPEVLRDLLDCLISIAAADGHITAPEVRYLQDVARRMGLSDEAFETSLKLAVASAIDDPYTVLGVSRRQPMAEIRSAWRKLVREYHPDRLVARGVPAERVERANAQLIAINDAFAAIQADRQPA